MSELNIDILVKNEVEKSVMQAINDLGIRAVMREKIVDAGITKEDIQLMIKESVDSYVRSADVEQIVRLEVQRLVKESVNKNIKDMFDMGGYDYRPNSVMRQTLEEEVRKAFFENFELSINIVPRSTEE